MRYAALIIMVIFSAVSFYAQGIENKADLAAKTKYTALMKKIKLKINKIVRPTQNSPVAAVIGIRGNRYDSKNKLYWKNTLTDKMKEKIVEESKKVEKMIERLESGDNEVIKDIDKYISENPNSYFSKELKEITENQKSETDSKTEN